MGSYCANTSDDTLHLYHFLLAMNELENCVPSHK